MTSGVNVRNVCKRIREVCQGKFNELMKIENEIIERLMKACNYKTKTALAEKHRMTLANFVNKQNAGSIWELIVNECIEHGVSVNWVKTGDNDPFIKQNHNNIPPIAKENLAPYLKSINTQSQLGSSDESTKAIRYAVKAYEILISNTGYANALRENILWFRKAVENEKRVLNLEDELSSLKKRLSESGIL